MMQVYMSDLSRVTDDQQRAWEAAMAKNARLDQDRAEQEYEERKKYRRMLIDMILGDQIIHGEELYTREELKRMDISALERMYDYGTRKEGAE